MDQIRTLPSLDAVARKGCPSHIMEAMLYIYSVLCEPNGS